MKEEDARLVYAIILSIVLLFPVLFVLSILWKVLFPTLSLGSFVVKQEDLLSYAWKQKTPVTPSVAIGSAILFFLVFEYLERKKWLDVRSPLTLLLGLLFIFAAYFLGLAGFSFFSFNPSLHYRNFFYFLYVPYWPTIAGLLAAWIALFLPVPKLFKEKAHQSSR